MRTTLDTIHHYLGPTGSEAKCRLEIFEDLEKPPVVIATELPDNPGISITNASEELATEVWLMLGAPQAGLTWVEHYLKRGERMCDQESFDLVEFTFDEARERFVDPRWRRLTPAELEKLIR